jgi:hypothetical protein
MMKTTPLDNALTKTYEEFNVPVDQFLGDSALIDAFVSAVQKRFAKADLDSLAIMRRLVNLRKQGKLPRLRRSYYGRNASEN